MTLENEEQAYMGRALSLTILKKGYGRDIAESWLMAQIEDLNTFCGVKKANEMQITELSRIILSSFWYLKTSEIMLFFGMFKRGDFGHFYGEVDPIVITTALNEFLGIRLVKLRQYKEQVNKAIKLKEQQEHDKISLTKEEWDDLRWLFNF